MHAKAQSVWEATKMKNTILVTGATGTIGTQVLTALAGRPDTHVRAGVRTAARAADLRRHNIEPVDFDFTRPASMSAALEGVVHVFFLPPMSERQVEEGAAFVELARKAGVAHIVKLSAFGCELEPGIQLGRWHRAVEKQIEAAKIGYTFLRPNNYMSNFLSFYRPAGDGNVYLPLGNGAVSYIDPRDVGEVAAIALTAPGLMGKALTLTGPEPLTMTQVATHLAKATDRRISYVDVPEAAARKAMLDMQMPGWVVDAMMELHAIDRAGYAAAVTTAVQEVIGHAPRRFADFAAEHAAELG